MAGTRRSMAPDVEGGHARAPCGRRRLATGEGLAWHESHLPPNRTARSETRWISTVDVGKARGLARRSQHRGGVVPTMVVHAPCEVSDRNNRVRLWSVHVRDMGDA